MSTDLDPRAAEVLRALRLLREPRLVSKDESWWSTGEVWNSRIKHSARWPRGDTLAALRRLAKLGLVEHQKAPYTSTGRLRDEWRAREEVRDV